MPLTLADLKAKRRSVTVTWEGETINIEYAPADVNPSYNSQVSALVKNGGGELDEAQQWALLLRVVKSWDLMDGDQPLPVSPEVLSVLPNSLLQSIVVAVVQDARPKAPTAATSNGG